MLEQANRYFITKVRSIDANVEPHNVREYSVEIGHCVFSDTIMLWSDCIDNNWRNKEDFDGHNFFDILRLLFGIALANGFPLRVGIAFGECVIKPEKQIFVGNAIVMAYQTEQCQDWIGVACHPSCLAAPHAKNLRGRRVVDGMFVGPIVPYPIPIKSTLDFTELQWTIDWPCSSGLFGVTKAFLTAEAAKHEGTPYVQRWQRALDYYVDCITRLWGGTEPWGRLPTSQ